MGQLRTWDCTLKPEATLSLSTFLLWEVGVWCCSAFGGHTREEDGIQPSITFVQINQFWHQCERHKVKGTESSDQKYKCHKINYCSINNEI